jgi:hypothetical protein
MDVQGCSWSSMCQDATRVREFFGYVHMFYSYADMVFMCENRPESMESCFVRCFGGKEESMSTLRSASNFDVVVNRDGVVACGMRGVLV